VVQIDLTAAAAYLGSLQAWVVDRGPWLIFVALFVECLPVAGLILPGLTLLVVVGFVASEASVADVVLTFVAAVSGVLTADTLAFVVGRLGLRRWAALQRLVARNGDLRLALAQQPWSVLILYQFPPLSRMFAPMLLGTLHVPWSRWWAITGPGTVLFVGAFFALGFVAGRTGHALLGAANAASTASTFSLVALGLWAVWIGSRIRRSRRACRLS